MNINLTIAKKAEELYMDSMNNLTIQAAIRQAIREYEEGENKNDTDIKSRIRELV